MEFVLTERLCDHSRLTRSNLRVEGSNTALDMYVAVCFHSPCALRVGMSSGLATG
jgi:hypothetical protein